MFGALNKSGQSLSECKISPQSLGGLVGLITKGTISGRIAKAVFAEMFESGKDPEKIVSEKGLEQVSDISAIEELVGTVLAENPEKIEEYQNGKEKLFGFFVGQVMKKSSGQANPGIVNEILRSKLKK